MKTLTMQSVSVALDNKEVLKDISLHIEQGEFVSILGPSGAGKSTIFRLLTGELANYGGLISCDAKPLKEKQHRFAFMPQHDALMPWRSILDNVTLGLEVQGVNRSAARTKVLPLFDEFGLTGFEQHYPSQLSGGMRQRAALLRTIVQNRPVQLLDEPFGALDALTRMQMQAWLEARRQTKNWTTLLVTHDVREAVALSDRIYVLSRRPATVIAEVAVPFPRPRLGRSISDAERDLEAHLLKILLKQTGDQI